MTSQIFKNAVPNELLVNLLNETSIKTDKYYIFNYNSYKKGIFNDIIPNFIKECTSYYYLSKRKYLERKQTYKNFLTIIRQICNFNNITYTSQIKYDKSTYGIEYFIHIL
jgi:hypothetical protein